MHFLRMFTDTNLNHWGTKADTDLAPEVFEEPFEDKGECPSLYFVESAEDELAAAGAFALTRSKQRLDNFFVVRLFQEDLNEFSLIVDDDRLGTTGVIGVDFRHFEIRNLTKPQAVHLTARVRNTARAGADRIRIVTAWLQHTQLGRFLTLADEQVIREAKRRCRWRLGGEGPISKATPAMIQAELDLNKPAVPLFRVARGAFLNYCGREQEGRPGCPNADWTNSEENLRQSYKTAFG